MGEEAAEGDRSTRAESTLSTGEAATIEVKAKAAIVMMEREGRIVVCCKLLIGCEKRKRRGLKSLIEGGEKRRVCSVEVCG